MTGIWLYDPHQLNNMPVASTLGVWHRVHKCCQNRSNNDRGNLFDDYRWRRETETIYPKGVPGVADSGHHRSILGQKSSKLSLTSLVLAFIPIWTCRKYVKSTQGRCLSSLGGIRVPRATYHISWPSVNSIQRRRFLIMFTTIHVYGHSGHTGDMTGIRLSNLRSLSPYRFNEIWLLFAQCFWEDVWKLSKYERSGSKIKECPWPIVLKLFMYSLRWLYADQNLL